MSDFTIKLTPKDVDLYRQWAVAREAEAAGWLKVRAALREYMERYVNVDINREVENLSDIYLPDLVHGIVEELLADDQTQEVK